MTRTAEHRPAARRRKFAHDDYSACDLFCVDEQTEILTAAGWKRYDQVAVGDIVLTIRPDGTEAEWQPVQAVNVFPAEPRKMQLIEGRGISALTTDNHRWLSHYRATTPTGRAYKWRIIRSDELTCEDRVPMSAPVANLPAVPAVPDAIVELVAWYWTEGTDRASGRVHIVQDHTVNPQHVAAIRSALAAAFGPEREKRKLPGGPLWAENRWGTQTTFGLNHAAAAALREAAPGKVPSIDWLATLTQPQLDLFIERSLNADGHERKRGTGRAERVLGQADQARASAFQAACLIAGHAASMKRYESTYRHGTTVRQAELWAVTVGMRQFVKPLRQKRAEWIEHDGIVWCPTTLNGTWMARRNGTAYFTGNSGFGGLSGGIERAGFETITAANHNRYKVGIHEANFPHAEHWIADLVDTESPTYHDVRDLPPATLLAAGISCTNHTVANSKKAYEQGLTLFDLDDPEYDARVTRSERDRATANCVLAYARVHHPLLILVECTTELASWGPAIPGRPRVGDGSTYRWWLKQFAVERYKHKILYLNSMFFGVPQSRDRWYGVFWDERLPAPDLAHRPHSWCGRCERVVEAVWTWRTGVPASGRVRYGEQYNYRCPACRTEVFPLKAPSLNALDLTNLGTRIGDKPVKTFRDGSTGPYAAATMQRIDRCLQRFTEFPPVLVPAEALARQQGHPWQPPAEEGLAALTGAVVPGHRHNGDGQHIGRPMDTVTGTHEKAALIASGGAIMGAAGNTFERPGSDCRSRGLGEPLWTQPATNSTGLLTPPLAVAVDNYQGAARGAGDPLPSQVGSETLGLLTARVLPRRQNGTSRGLGEPMETLVGNAGGGGLGLLTAGGTIKHNGPASEAKYRAHPLSDPLGAVTATAVTQAVLFSGWYKQNGSTATETAPHPLSDPLGTLTGRDTTAVLSAEWVGEWREAMANLKRDDCYYKMLGPHEVGWGCGFDVSFPGYGYEGSFRVWGSAAAQVDGYGNAVSPPVGEWIGTRLRAVLV